MDYNYRRRLFNKISDYLDWEKQAEWVLNDPELEAEFKFQILLSYSVLSRILGNNLHENYKTNNSSFFQMMANTATWCYQKKIWMAEALSRLENVSNFDLLVSKLRVPDQYEEALSVLESANKFLVNGFSISLESSIEFNGINKKPDICIQNIDGPEFYIEVSCFDESLHIKTNSLVGKILNYKFPLLSYAGRIHKDLDDANSHEWTEHLAMGFNEAISLGSFKVVQYKDYLTLGVVNRNFQTEFQNWCTKNKLRPDNIYLPAENFDPITRLKRKIQTKQRQLPAAMSNIIIIKMKGSQTLFIDPKRILTELTKYLTKYTHVSAVFIYDRFLGLPQENPRIDFDSSYFISKSVYEVEQENLFVIYNEKAKRSIDKNLLFKIALSN